MQSLSWLRLPPLPRFALQCGGLLVRPSWLRLPPLPRFALQCGGLLVRPSSQQRLSSPSRCISHGFDTFRWTFVRILTAICASVWWASRPTFFAAAAFFAFGSLMMSFRPYLGLRLTAIWASVWWASRASISPPGARVVKRASSSSSSISCSVKSLPAFAAAAFLA